MVVNHQGGRKGQVPQNFEWATLMQTVPTDIMLQNFKHHKRTSSTFTKSPLQSENATFFGEDTVKEYRSVFTITRHFK